MARESRAAESTSPRPGAFAVMLLGLFVFFGFVSRIGKVNTPEALLGQDRPSAASEERERLDAARDHVIAIIGGAEAEAVPVRATVRETVRDVPAPPAQAVEQPPRRTQPPRPAHETPRSRPRPVRPDRSDRIHTVEFGDTLYSIARAAYGDGGQWRRIVLANPGLRPETLRAGMRLRLPVADDARVSDAGGRR